LHKKAASVTVENVVVTASVRQKLDLESIAKVASGVKYRPEQFPGLIYKLKKPKTATLIFGSGKMVCTGSRSARQARRAIMKVIEELKRNSIVILQEPEIKVQNIVASGNLNGIIDIEGTAESLQRTMYEPEQFPGLIYRMDEPKVVMLLFASGRLVCAGAKNEDQVYEAVNKLQESLEAKELISYSEESLNEYRHSHDRPSSDR